MEKKEVRIMNYFWTSWNFEMPVGHPGKGTASL